MLLKKTIVSLVLVLFLALPEAYAQNLSSADSVAVFDSTGKRVATVQEKTGRDAEVFFQVDGLVLAMEAERDGLEGSHSVVFVSADCSGQPWLEEDGEIFAPNQLIQSTGEFFVADRSVPPQMLDLNSERRDDGSCRSRSPFSRSVFPVLEFPGLFAHFTPPFSVRVDKAATPAGPPNFPALIRGAGSSSQVVVGAGDTALSVDSSFHAPDGSLLETQSIQVPANGASSIDFEGGDLEFGSLALAVEPPNAHVLSTEIISLVGAPLWAYSLRLFVRTRSFSWWRAATVTLPLPSQTHLAKILSPVIGRCLPGMVFQ